MVKRNWGTKRVCKGCDARFYDLNREKPQCPKCGAEYVAGNPQKARHRAAPPEPPPAVEPVPPSEDEHVVPLKGVVKTAEDDEDDDLEKVKGDEEGLIEDASELRKDDDDVSEVREHVDDGVEDKG